jgi:hypothetical protein
MPGGAAAETSAPCDGLDRVGLNVKPGGRLIVAWGVAGCRNRPVHGRAAGQLPEPLLEIVSIFADLMSGYGTERHADVVGRGAEFLEPGAGFRPALGSVDSRSRPAVGYAAAAMSSTGMHESADDAEYRAAVADILGVLAYGELMAFERLAYDARMAPTLDDKAALGRLATAEFEHFAALATRLSDLGIPASAAIEPFVEPLEEFHARTAPSDWAESLIKAYVGDGLMRDFYREVTRVLDAETRVVVEKALADTEHVTFLAERLRRIMAEDPRCAGRLALWARRIVGEALLQARLVATRREALVRLLAGGRGVDLSAAFDRIIQAHAGRMAAIGLAA